MSRRITPRRDPNRRRLIRPARALACGLVLALGAAGACGPRATTGLGATPATPVAARLPGGPPPPTAGLGFHATALDWSPPQMTAGGVRSLVSALEPGAAITVHVGPRLDDPEFRAGVSRFVADATTASPVDGGPLALASLVGDEALPVQRTVVDGEARYSAAALTLEAGAGDLLGAATSLVIDEAAVDLAAWNALETLEVGSCEAPMRALAGGQERSLALLAPFLDHADALLAQVFRARLRAELPGMLGSLRGATDSCATARRAYLEAYEPCLRGEACRLAPRVLLSGGALIGMVEPSALPDACVRAPGRDVQAELRDMARSSAKLVGESLDPRWAELADRLGAVTEVHAALAELCVPRRRRFAKADVDEARARFSGILAALAGPPVDVETGAFEATWLVEDGRFLVPGIGEVVELARFDAGSGAVSRDVVARARGLRSFVFSRARCRTLTETRPLAALVVEGAAIKHFGYLYAEELRCEELGPRR
ncbi:MAG: hypothetical protein R3A51_20790 [Nannocystaceae bacterium]